MINNISINLENMTNIDSDTESNKVKDLERLLQSLQQKDKILELMERNMQVESDKIVLGEAAINKVIQKNLEFGFGRREQR